MELNRVILCTQAYNAAATLQRTINSVRKQTHTDWVWFVIDNCSSDSTGSIIMNEAIQDPRIIPLRLNRNNIAAYVKFWLILKNNFPDCYLMSLDADDTIHPECLEKLLCFMQEQELDIAACGTEFISADPEGNPVTTKVRNLKSDLILENGDFANAFYTYRSFTNELWAKLYRFSVVTEQTMAAYSAYHYDSQVVLQLFENAQRVGILSQPLHRAYLRSGTLSHSIKGILAKSSHPAPIEEQVSHWIDGTQYVRCISYMVDWKNVNETFEFYKKYLEKYGPLSEQNEEYLYAIYIGWIHENLIQIYLALSAANGHTLYSTLLKLLHSEVFRTIFSYKPRSEQFHNLKKRDAILTQMYHFVSASEYSASDPEFIWKLKAEIQKLREELAG